LSDFQHLHFISVRPKSIAVFEKLLFIGFLQQAQLKYGHRRRSPFGYELTILQVTQARSRGFKITPMTRANM